MKKTAYIGTYIHIRDSLPNANTEEYSLHIKRCFTRDRALIEDDFRKGDNANCMCCCSIALVFPGGGLFDVSSKVGQKRTSKKTIFFFFLRNL